MSNGVMVEEVEKQLDQMTMIRELKNKLKILKKKCVEKCP